MLRIVVIPKEIWAMAKYIGYGSASRGITQALAPHWGESALRRLGFPEDLIESIIATDNDDFEEQCPICHKYWAYFNRDFTEFICPRCGRHKSDLSQERFWNKIKKTKVRRHTGVR